MNSLVDKVAFITGAASGLGFALSAALAKRGAKVMMSDFDPQALEVALEQVQQLNPDTRSVLCDVRKREDIYNAAAYTKSTLGDVSILVNNAGVGIGGGPAEVSEGQWAAALSINLMGVVHGVDAFLEMLKINAPNAHIVNTGSMASFLPSEKMLPYSATKHAVIGYSESLERALAPEGIFVSALCPGFVKTNLMKTSQLFDQSQNADAEQAAVMTSLVENGIDPAAVAELTLDAILNKRFYIFTDRNLHEQVRLKHRRMNDDLSSCACFLEQM